MDLHSYFAQIAAGYRHLDGTKTPTQDLIGSASSVLAEHAYGGMVIHSGGGKGGVATFTPWTAWLDPDATESPTRGMYVIYIFSEDLATLTLTVNQGMEKKRADNTDSFLRELLASDAAAIRERLSPADISDWSDPMDLRSKGPRQRAYEAGHICCRRYEMSALPPEDELRADLAEALRIYGAALEVKRNLLLTEPGLISSPSSSTESTSPSLLLGFKPKDAGDYKAQMSGREMIKSRKHERLVADFEEHCRTIGFDTGNPHPIDLAIEREKQGLVIVEAKMVYRSNATDAVRAAVGQLLTYSHFLFVDPTPQPNKLALFSEDVGRAYCDFLDDLEIATVWRGSGQWQGTASAELLGVLG